MLKELRERTLSANLELFGRNLAILTWGNASEIDRERGLVAIKPSGVPYAEMKAEDIVIVDLDGKLVEGRYRPSSDLPTHLVLYKAFPSCGGVVHTHSTNAAAFAQAGVDIPAEGTTHADYFYGPVPCTREMTEEEIGGDYEAETGRVIVETFRSRGMDPASVPAVLVKGHGPFTWGADADEAVHNAIVLEEVSKMAILSRIAGTPPGISRRLLDKHFLRKHGPSAYYGQGKQGS
jgi:L-ribulose-5-phosphate 4-epimerase